MKNLKLGGKIGGGFGLLILIVLILGGLAVWNMSAAARNSRILAQEFVPEVMVAGDIERNYQLYMFDMRGYAMSQREDLYELAQGHAKRVKKALAEANDLAAKSEHLANLRDSANAIGATLKQYEDLVAKTVEVNRGIDAARKNMDASAAQFIENAYDFQKSQMQKLDAETGAVDAARLRERQRKLNVINSVIDLGNFTRVANFRAQALRDPKLVLDALGNFDKIRNLLEEIRPLVRQEQNLRELVAIQGAANSYRESITAFVKNWEALQELTKQREKLANQLVALVQEVSKAGIDNTRQLSIEAESSLTLSNYVMVIGLVVALILGVLVAVMITRSIVNPVRTTVEAVGQAAKGDFSFTLDKNLLARGDELGEMLRDVDKMAENLSVVVTESTAAAETVASSAGEISQGNQDLSERTQQQASAIEETASSIEEMTSSVKQNANNSQQANELARRTATMAVQGGEVVQRTVGAMAAVTESS
ncbi:MAG: HAMP domain-containing protein, partial [Desulfarculus sp.]|nr:HAMP domain-containing protein [Desulfarculus sp.]